MGTTTKQDIEVAALIGTGNRIIVAYLGIPGYVPDSHQRWRDIWEAREDLVEIAHTHPRGALGFSHEDETTMSAVEIGLGRKLRWSVITEDGYLVRNGNTQVVKRESLPWWVDLLRAASYHGVPERRAPCGMKSHAMDCDCGGMGGDR